MFEHDEGILSIVFPRSQEMEANLDRFHFSLPCIPENTDHITGFIVQATLSFASNVACQGGYKLVVVTHEEVFRSPKW